MTARFQGFSRRSPVTQAEELESRYRSLVAAELILERQRQPGGGSAALRADRLRHLRLYIRNAIAAVERQMKEQGIDPPSRDEIEAPASHRPQPRDHHQASVREG